MTAVDVGSAMGFFSLPLARMVGDSGRVVCVDLQDRMLSSLERRARRKGLDRIIETRRCTQQDLGLDDLAGEADLALAIHVVHESGYPRRFLTQIHQALKPGGRLLVIEPKGHVTDDEFEATRQLCEEVGFERRELLQLKPSRAMLLQRPLTS
jgi:ubiquinone/menaquinone biosynthesis C-methylase UbiE